MLQWLVENSCRGSFAPRLSGSVALDLPSLLKLDILIFVDRPKGSSWMAGGGGLGTALG